MLGKPSYESRVLLRTLIPALPLQSIEGTPIVGEVWIGGFDLRAQSEWGVWRRLLNSEAIEFNQVLLVEVGTPSPIRELEAVTPRSQRSHMAVQEDSQGEWRRLIQPDRPERSFGMVLREGIAPILVVGLPTEEIWDEFLTVLASR